MEIKMEQSLLIEWSCSICRFILRKPLKSCNNGHNMCGECYDRLLKEYEPRSIDPQCPECRISIVDACHNMLAERTMNHIKVKCPNVEQCKKSIFLLDYNDHVENDCEYAMVKCKYSSCGCSWTGFNKHSTDHISKCKFERISALWQEMCAHFQRVTKRLDEMSRRTKQIQNTVMKISETIKIHDSYINSNQRQRIDSFFYEQSIMIKRIDDTHYCTTHSFAMFKHNWILGLERLKSLTEFGLYLRRNQPTTTPPPPNTPTTTTTKTTTKKTTTTPTTPTTYNVSSTSAKCSTTPETHLSVSFKVYTFDTFTQSWKEIVTSDSQRQIIHKYTNSEPVAVIRKCIGSEHESSVAQSVLLHMEAIELSCVKKITTQRRHHHHHHHHKKN